MGKSYIENSLKRFLKRKVKITLGLVVTFLITGMVVFADPTVNVENKETGQYLEFNEDLIGIEISKDLGILNKEINYNDGTKTLVKVENSKIIISYPKNENIEISSDKISNRVLENLKITSSLLSFVDENGYIADNNINGKNIEGFTEGLQYKQDVGAEDVIDSQKRPLRKVSGVGNVSVNQRGNVLERIQWAENGATLVNYGVIGYSGTNGQAIVNGVGNGGGQIYNYGIIKNSGQHGQNISADGAIGYNYGIICNENYNGQSVFKKETTAYNYGVIANKLDSGMVVTKNAIGSKLYNYGLIVNENTAQIIEGTNSESYNYGIIANNGINGQITEGTGNKSINYGLIINSGRIEGGGDGSLNGYGQSVGGSGNSNINYGVIANNGRYGQYTNGENNISYNYGIIANKGDDGQYILDNNTSYNYGIIANEGHNIHSGSSTATGYNYGILVNKKGASTHGNVINNGIILVQGGTGEMEFGGNQEGTNNGVIYNKGNITVGDRTLILEENKNISDIVENNIFVNNSAVNSNVILTIDREKLEDKHITAVFGKESQADTAVKANNDLTIKDTSIIGYFEKNGTLLSVNGNLILEGNSVINAVAGNSYTGYTGDKLDDVIAVKLADKGILTIKDSSKVLGAVKGNGTITYINSKKAHLNTQDVDSIKIETTEKETTNITLANIKLTDKNNFENISGKLIIDNQSSEKLKDKELSTSITLANNINIQNGIDGSSSANGIELILGDGQISSDETIKIGGEILLGQADDTIIINNILGKYEDKAAVINGNGGDDTVNLKNSNGKHDTFDYTLKNIETLDLGNSSWKIGENAGISHGEITKADEKTEIKNGTLLGELTGNTESTDFINSKNVNNILENSSFGENGEFQIGVGKNMKLEAGAEYNINDDTAANLEKIKDNVTASAIFTEATEQGKDIRVKSAEEMNIDERYSGIYNEMLENASSNEEILNVLNNSSASEITDTINSKGALGDTLATTGYKITRDITNSFMSAVNEWDKKANKGEWLANAKYISSDVEYDGANNVKGYDSDINSMVGMIEYGVSENTSYGIALGGGDTEVDVKGAGTLEGDNYYIGAYAKHSVNGFDLIGNLGYTISDLDVDGKGSADSSAVTLGGYIKRDIALTETVRLEPNFAFTYDYIMQDNAEGNGVKVDNKDIHVFEATAGVNIVKGFNIEKGVLELKAGVKYSIADINRNEETIISVYGDDINLGNPEVDKTRGTAHVGFDYEHETGFGVNGKYEMMWSDSGDDSRITAGVSYRF